MRCLKLIKGDLRFIKKYGILFLYLFFTLLYLMLLSLFDGEIRKTVGVILIFTDPAAMGLFFMGAIILLEKSQRVHCSLAVAPIKISEYICAKVSSIALLSTLVGLILGGYSKANIIDIGCAVFLSSTLFSFCGLIVATKSDSLNRFLLLTVPFELLLFLPAILYQFGFLGSQLWLSHPCVSAMHLMLGREDGKSIAFVSLLVSNWILFLWTKKAVLRYFQQMGGGKL